MIMVLLKLLLLLFVGCYLPAFAVFHDHSRRVSLLQSGMYVTISMGGLGVFVILTKVAGVDMNFSLIPGILFSGYALIRYGKHCLPDVQFPEFNIHLLIAVFISAIYFLNIFIPGIFMGRGAYPSVSFGPDTLFYLSQVHALIRFDTWPPPTLQFLGGAAGYHYGSQSICALVSRFTGITPHAAVFLVVIPFTTFGILCTTWLIVREHGTQKPLI
jgi:hypothetical protein